MAPRAIVRLLSTLEGHQVFHTATLNHMFDPRVGNMRWLVVGEIVVASRSRKSKVILFVFVIAINSAFTFLTEIQCLLWFLFCNAGLYGDFSLSSELCGFH